MSDVGAVPSESVHHCRQIHDQHDSSVPKDGSSTYEIRGHCLIVQRLDDQFFFPFERVHHESEFPLAKGCDQHKESCVAIILVTFAKPHQRKDLISELQDFGRVHPMKIGALRARYLSNRIQGNSVEPVFDAEQQCLDDGQRQRQLQPKLRALTDLSLELDRSLQPMQHTSNYVEPHAASGNLGDLLRGAESWPEDQVQRFSRRHSFSFFCIDDVNLERLGLEFVVIDTRAVVAHFNDQLVC